MDNYTVRKLEVKLANMFDSFMSMLGTPKPNNIATPTPNNIVTVNTASNSSLAKLSSSLRAGRHPTSNSTILDPDERSENNLSNSSNLSTVSPLKMTRDNSMSTSSSSSFSDNNEPNASLFLKHNINSVNLDDPGTQKIALHYLLEKVRDIESLLIESVKDNKELKEEVSELYHQNDSLAAENITLKEMISKQGNDNRVLSDDLVCLKEILKAEREKFVNITKINCTSIERDICAIEADIDYLGDMVPMFDDLVRTVKELQEGSKHFKEEIVRLEKELMVTNQYNRRQNLIIDGIPDNVPQKDLENVCLDIVHKIGFLPVGNYEVVGCHRLKRRHGDKSAPTIIRFVNRKITEYCIKNRWKLKNLKTSWNLAFREDLCDYNLAILEKCEHLKSQGHIENVYTHNGFVKVVKHDTNRPIKISHIRDIEVFLSGTS